MYFDTHAHYNDEQFDNDRHDLLAMMRENNIGTIMNACAAMNELDSIKALTEKYDFIYGAVGVHPSDVDGLKESDMDTLVQYAQNPKIKAIGEIGLDYYYKTVSKKVQRDWFARQIELAKQLKLPVIIHDRDAHADTLDILRACHAEEVGGVLHCFSGSRETAREILDMGMYIAFGGTLTFKNAVRPAEVCEYVPMDRILLETDAPYLTPVPCRGKRNCSLYLPFTAKRMAEIKGISIDEVERITAENGMKCFNIDS